MKRAVGIAGYDYDYYVERARRWVQEENHPRNRRALRRALRHRWWFLHGTWVVGLLTGIVSAAIGAGVGLYIQAVAS